MKRTRKRKASDTAQLRMWRWLNWNKEASWVCKCANANGYAVPQCPDCMMRKPAPPTITETLADQWKRPERQPAIRQFLTMTHKPEDPR